MRYYECHNPEIKKIFEKLYEEHCAKRKENGVEPLPIKDFLLCGGYKEDYYLYYWPDIDD